MAADYRSMVERSGRLVVQVCGRCGVAFWPPRLQCDCGSDDLHWVSGGDTGRVVSAVGVDVRPVDAARHGVPRRLIGRLPYTTLIVELDDWANVRVATLADGMAPAAPEPGSNVVIAAEGEPALMIIVARHTDGLDT